MCGIAGWVDTEADLTREQQTVRKMGEMLAKRGPDAEGLWVSQRAALAHRRLVVIDPQGGKQPMLLSRGQNTYVIVYNGELYNTEDLRSELKACGHTFKGHSDTEVLLTSYVEWGPRSLEKLNGIFAFAVWETAEQRLFLARDRLGVKPLFYFHRGGTFLFGSEIKALLAHPLVAPEIDAEGLAEVFALGPARTPGHGVFSGVEELRPGWCLTCCRGQVSHHRYWSLDSRIHEQNAGETVADVRDLFMDTVHRQLVSDVPLCVLLSGGLDSSAITACAARSYRERGSAAAMSFSVDYKDNQRYFRRSDFQPDSDAPWVAQVSEFLGTDHHRVELDTPALARALEAALDARDLPGMADVDSSLLLFSREIKKTATVALSGECADEIFGGYPWFYRDDALEAYTFPWSLKLRKRVSLLAGDTVDHIKPFDYVRRRYLEALAEVPTLPGEDAKAAHIREISYLTLTRWMPVLLDRKDRMSMATGLEIRVPFCDHRLVEYLWNVPWAVKNFGGREKGVFRQAMQGFLPPEVLQRKKSPYPKTHNPDYLEAVRKLLREALSQPSSPLRPLLNAEAVRTLLTPGDDFDIPWFGQLMRLPQMLAFLYQVDLWMRTYRISLK